MAYTLIAATTGAVTSPRFDLKLADLPVTLSATNLATTEVVDVQISQDGGATFADTGFQLTAAENTKVITGPGIYKADKDATASSVAVALHRNDNI